MGSLTRFKRTPEGLRQLVQLWETTPLVRRQKIIELAKQEDPEYTKKALEYVITFEDILKLPDLELAEVLAATPPQQTAYALHQTGNEVRDRIFSRVKLPLGHEIKEALANSTPNPTLVEGAQLKMVEVTRKLERTNVIRTKKIPLA